jgi:hypothetical protein
MQEKEGNDAPSWAFNIVLTLMILSGFVAIVAQMFLGVAAG